MWCVRGRDNTWCVRGEGQYVVCERGGAIRGV